MQASRWRTNAPMLLRALTAALASIPLSALLVDGRANILVANERGRGLAARAGEKHRATRLSLLRQANVDETFRVVATGGGCALLIERSSMSLLIERLEHARTRWALTRRQHEVLELIVRGSGNKAIASVLRCAEGTVELHVTTILAKASATTRAELTAKFWLDLALE